MASFPISRYFAILYFFIFNFKSLTADPNSSFSFKNFGQNSSLGTVLALYGDAKVVNGGSSLQITAPSVSSAGRVVYKKPIKLYGGIPKKLVSFSTYFSFSISSDSKNGDGLAFVVFSDGYPLDSHDNDGSFGPSNGDNFNFLSVEFGTSRDDKYGDMNRNHIGIDLSNLANLILKNGDSLQVWIDYESGSRRIEVRLSKLFENRPLDPLPFHQIDLPKIFPETESVFVGLASSNGNSSQVCNVYSWSFKTKRSPDWMHSQPLDPMVFKDKEEDDDDVEMKIHKKSDCVMTVLSALIIGVGLGGLGSLIGVFMWTIFGPKSYGVKVKPVVVDKDSLNAKEDLPGLSVRVSD